MSVRRRSSPIRMLGITLVEMMIGVALSLLLTLAAISLLVSSRATFTAQDESGRMAETGQYAISIIERAVRQAGHENWDADGRVLIQTSDMSPAILGLDDVRLPDMPAALEPAASPGVNGSDVLAVRFFGSGDSAGNGDGRVLDCAGVTVAEPAGDDLDEGRGWSIFHVGRTGDAEPELRCKTRGRNGVNWSSEAIAPGVESMQVLYGVDQNADGLPDRFVNATALRQGGAATTNGNPWNDVVAVRVALLVRGTERLGDASGDRVFDLFGPAYSARYGATDPGAQFRETSLAADERQRARRVFALSIPLRSRAGVNPAGPSS